MSLPVSHGKRKRLPGKQAAEDKPWRAVRKGKVARARKLLSDPNYPSTKVLDSVARLLAKHLQPPDRSI